MTMSVNAVRRLGPDASIVAVVREEYAAGRPVSVVPAGVDKAESLRLFADILDFPDYFGGNLDALYDCLRQVATDRPDDWALVWDAAGALRAGDPAAYDGIVGVLADVAADAGQLHVTVLDR